MNISEDKIAVVTGAGGGIGRESCLALARAGARIVAVDIDEEAAQATRAACADNGGAAMALAADMTAERSVAAVMSAATERFGRIDVLFNNAGIEGMVRPIEDYPLDEFERVIATNLHSVFLGIKHVMPLMRAQGGGSIINCASVSGLRGTAGVSAYVASKHGVIGLTRAAAAEGGAFGVRVNAVCPGPIETRMMNSITEMTSPDDPEAARAASLAKNPMGRWGRPEEVAGVVVLLASEATSYVNGAVWTVDGGRTAV